MLVASVIPVVYQQYVWLYIRLTQDLRQLGDGSGILLVLCQSARAHRRSDLGGFVSQ